VAKRRMIDRLPPRYRRPISVGFQVRFRFKMSAFPFTSYDQLGRIVGAPPGTWSPGGGINCWRR